jgi:DNA-binding transcriptional LysR family regulator
MIQSKCFHRFMKQANESLDVAVVQAAMNPTLRQLRAFVAVAEAGSFTEAARSLHLTQSALSVLVRELERELGVRLFDRHTRRVELSEAGRDFQPYVRRLFNELREGTASLGGLRDKDRGKVRIAAPQMMACTLMPLLIRGFRERHPRIELELADTLPEQMIQQVEIGDADLAVGPDVPMATPAIVRRPLLRDRHWLVCCADDPMARRRSVQWKDLRQSPFIAPTRDFIRQLRIELGPATPTPAHETSYMTTALGMVAAGIGVTACPTSARPLVRAWGLTMKSLVAPAFDRQVCIYALGRRSLSPAAASFADFAVEFVARR